MDHIIKLHLAQVHAEKSFHYYKYLKKIEHICFNMEKHIFNGIQVCSICSSNNVYEKIASELCIFQYKIWAQCIQTFIHSFKKFSNFRKMKVKVLLFVYLFASLHLPHSEAYISINIDPDDLDRVSDFFHSIRISEQAQLIIPTHSVIKSLLKKTVFGIIQLSGVMIALIGVNVISPHLIPDVQPVQHQTSEIIFQNSSLTTWFFSS